MKKTTKLIEFEGWRVPVGFSTDGCTCAPDTVFGVNITDACAMHDFLRRHICYYSHMTPSEADKIFRRHIKALGGERFVATIYWFFVAKIMRRFFTRTFPLPVMWFDYKYARQEAV